MMAQAKVTWSDRRHHMISYDDMISYDIILPIPTNIRATSTSRGSNRAPNRASNGGLMKSREFRFLAESPILGGGSPQGYPVVRLCVRPSDRPKH